MALVLFGSQKGSPGASLTALAVAGTWPVRQGRQCLLVEADPAGGAIAMRYGLAREPGLLTLASAVRHGSATTDEILEHAQVLPGGLKCVVAPEHSSSVDAVFKSAGAALGQIFSASVDLDVIVDVGRLSSRSTASVLASFADTVFMVARPCVDQIVPGAEILKSSAVGRWCLIGERPYSAEHVAESFGIPAFVVADDPRGAQMLETGGSSKKLKRSALMRSARELAETIDGALNPTALQPETARPSQLLTPDRANTDPVANVVARQ